MNKKIRIKVCGLKYPSNRKEAEKLPVDLLGFIFYTKTARYVGQDVSDELFNSVKPKVAVFVNEDINEILKIAGKFGFGFIQLHGTEDPSVCRVLKGEGYKVLKAFNINEDFRFDILKSYEEHTDYFLFDTKTIYPGGSGKKFNWDLLEQYKGNTPFFLSGGIGPGDAKVISNFRHPQFYGIDLNSGFEDEPGLKNIDKLKNFIKEFKSL